MKPSMKNAEFGQDFKMTVISLMKKHRIQTRFQNDGDILNEKTPNSVISKRKIQTKIRNGCDILNGKALNFDYSYMI